MRTGKKPYSVKNPITGEWVRYNRFEPLGMLLGIAGDLGEIGLTIDKGELERVAPMMITSVALNLGDKTFLRGITDFANAYADPKRYFDQWANNMAGTLVPNIAAQAARAKDPFVREARGMADSFRARIPGLRETLPVKLDISGEPIERSLVEPLATSAERDDKLAKAMLQLGVFRGKPGRTVSLGGRTITLTGEEYQSLVESVQTARWERLTPLVTSKRFQELMKSDSWRAAMVLEKLYDQIGTAERTRWIIKHREIRQRLMASPMKVHKPSKYESSGQEAN
jgi:hypothetical protein